ncbi:MAG: FG-GAP-like repeat-containing protein [bacterium]|jgi:hypothetical protein
MPATPNRNDPCPCGSGKKYKQCCAKTSTATPPSNSSSPPLKGIAIALVVVVAIAATVLFKRGDGPPASADEQSTGGTSEPFEVAARANAALSESESHTRMLALLERIGRGTSTRHPYLGRAMADRIVGALSSLGAEAPIRQRWELNFGAGEAELQLGNLQAAIEYLTVAHDLLPIEGLDAQATAYNKFKLGVAYLRLAETQNCCLLNQPESCIIPIRGGGLHTKTEGSSRAIEYFEAVLAADTGTIQTGGGLSNAAPSLRMNLAAQWLLNIAYMTLDLYPDGVPEQHRIPVEGFESSIEFPRFKNISKSIGLDSYTLCGGLISDDFDGDGYLDVITTTWDPTGGLRYFRNQRDGSFSDQTEAAGLEGIVGGLNCLQADYDNDGWLDVLVLRGAWLGVAGRHPNSLLRNNGDGSFTDVSFRAGLAETAYPTQTAAWADYDLDGDLDLYIGNESTPQLASPSQLFRNEGDGTFIDVAADAGVLNERFSKGVSWGDFDEDGDPDLYVSNYDSANRLYRNNGDGSFTDIASSAGVVKPTISFPTWFWDYDNDGHLDLFASSYTGRIDHVVEHFLGKPPKYEPAMLYRGDGTGGFSDVSEATGLRYPMLPMGGNFGDIDNDGFLDMHLGTGDPDFASLMPNLMFLNRGGEQFIDVTMAGGFGHLQKGHGVSFADLDNDGDVDLLEQMGGAFRGDEYADAVFENPGFGNTWLGVKLEGRSANRSAIGARIRIAVKIGDAQRIYYRHIGSGGSFGANPLRQTIGLGEAEEIAWCEVEWPSQSSTQRVEFLPLNSYVHIVEGEAGFKLIELETLPLGD